MEKLEDIQVPITIAGKSYIAVYHHHIRPIGGTNRMELDSKGMAFIAQLVP